MIYPAATYCEQFPEQAVVFSSMGELMEAFWLVFLQVIQDFDILYTSDHRRLDCEQDLILF